MRYLGPGVSIRFSDWGGGGGGGNFKFFGALRAQNHNIQLCTQSAPQNSKLCMLSSIFMLNLMVFQGLAVFFKPILALHIINFSSCRKKRYVCSPQYFHGGDCPPPPQDRCLCLCLKGRGGDVLTMELRRGEPL